jgi:diguanylate cyclase (GGDEF)-like protein
MTASDDIIDILMAGCAEAIVIADAVGRVTRVNRAAAALLGGSAGSNGVDTVVSTGVLTEALTAEPPVWLGSLALGDGISRPIRVTKARVPSGLPGGALPSGALRYGAIIAWISLEGGGDAPDMVDPLTGLPGRAIFLDRTSQAILAANRLKKSVAVFLIGADRLSLVNEALGFSFGDRVLTELAVRLCNSVRAVDTVSRLESDRFGLSMEMASPSDGALVAAKIFRAVQEPLILDGRELSLAVSIGIALYPKDASTPAELEKKAESALRQAKASGGRQYQFVSHDMNNFARKRLDLEERLTRAVRHQEFVVHYQPKVEADSGRVVGMEALVRWQDPERGLIMPGDFIAVAEETGLIEQIGLFVLNTACHQATRWRAEGLPPLKLSVNVSARQFRSNTLLHEVMAILRDTEMPPELLELELTESVLMADTERATARLFSLRLLGVSISIDDFGTGYSSLNYLAEFPITTMKIDRSFVQNSATNPKSAEIAKAIIGLSNGLRMDVIAEGAEIAEHVRFLQDHGCNVIQGYYFSRPLPPDQFAKFVRARMTEAGG